MRQPAKTVVALLLFALLSVNGCAALRVAGRPDTVLVAYSPLESAQAEIAQAREQDAVGDARCVDAYFRACFHLWQTITAAPSDPQGAACRQRYNQALCALLEAACRHRRLDPTSGLTILEEGRAVVASVAHQAFPWDAADFCRLHPPPAGNEPLLRRRYACPGLGAPLVVERGRRPWNPIETRFYPETSFFAATAMLRFGDAGSAEGQSPAEAAVLEFLNPLAVPTIQVGGCEFAAAADLSAPLAQALERAPRTYFAGFVDPGGASSEPRLHFLEPYQPGKAPVVLVHGLFSDPQSWADLINDLRATPGFCERRQIWVFRYPTGRGFLQSAAALRRELQAAQQALDPSRSDPALRQMVLVGHSMGGLISKLQVTYSGESIWSRLANRPLETIVTTDETRAFLAENCYFDPSPAIAKVIFVATPHGGSLFASGLIGNGASLLVQPAPAQAELHQQLLRDNPQTFNPAVEARFPTSIDLLKPQSPLLDAMREMRLRPGVELHNILGVSHPISLDGPSDGVVSVRSATHPCCRSLQTVGAPHAEVHRTLAASCEIARILGLRHHLDIPPGVAAPAEKFAPAIAP